MRGHAEILVRWLFLRALALVALVAFLSFHVQIDALIGSRGILPVEPWLADVRDTIPGVERFFDVPTLFWLDASDRALHLATIGGALASIALAAGVWPRAMLVVIWALYLSLQTVGRTFTSFQWDILLTELAFTALLFAPRGLWPGLARDQAPSRAGLFILRVLLFKLMFSSGVVKLTSGDLTWRELTALDWHFETQPIPNPIAWWMHHLPHWAHAAGTMFTFAVQLGGAVAIFLPRPARITAGVLLVLHQLSIAATGNYGFFNLAALALLVVAFDDDALLRALPLRWRSRVHARLDAVEEGRAQDGPSVIGRVSIARTSVAVVLASVLVVLNGLQLARTISKKETSGLAREVLAIAAPFRSVNGYGLFAVMTTVRNELVLEGSDDGVTWKAYALPYQAGDPLVAPPFVAPHMPRLDWQMWFAALGSLRQNGWLVRFVDRLLAGEPAVKVMLAVDPFPDHPPRQIRVVAWCYRFSDPDERARTGAWWTRTPAGEYMAPRGALSASDR